MRNLYKFRQAECPVCGHIFMWQEYSHVGTSYCSYRRKGYKEELMSTCCPKCNLKMIVPNDSLKGIDIRDENAEVADLIRGL